ncbi:hypothetical protein [Nocardia altamirensis]|uniref:hypothetical protein n=1 Tax=Nocardia altamirensis TaxID=472158 RepID=UPI00114CA59A|nr:hypothetical protein [Nocardia altamirensis]
MGFWEGFADIAGDVLEVALPTVGTLFGPGGRLLGGALGNVIDEALDGDIDSFGDFAEAAGMGAGAALFGGMLGGAAGKLVGKAIPALRGATTDSLGFGMKMKTPDHWQLELAIRAGQTLVNPRALGTALGAGAGNLALDGFLGEDKPVALSIPVKAIPDLV